MNNPQIYRDITQVLEFFTKKGWSENMPKVWRFTLYPVMIDYILTMLSASADAYDMQEGREANIRKVISNLRKTMSLTRVFREAGVISIRQGDYLDRFYEKIDGQTHKWLKSVKKKTVKPEVCGGEAAACPCN